MSDHNGTWCYAISSRDRYTGSEPTREAAIFECINSYGLKVGAKAWVGQAFDVPWGFSRYELMESLGESVSEFNQDGDDWPDANDDMQKELAKEVNAVVDAWIARHGLEPTFWQVSGEEEFTVTEEMLAEMAAAQSVSPSLTDDRPVKP